MIAPAAEAGVMGRENSRALVWAACLAVVMGLHAIVAWSAVHWPVSRLIEPPPLPAVLIDLPPVAEPAPPEAAAPPEAVAEPEPLPPLPTEPEPPPPPEPEPLPPPPPPVREVAVPLPVKPPPRPKPAVRQEPRVERPSSQAVAAPAQSPPPQAAPAPAPGPVAPSNAVPTWQGLLMTRLQQARRYPSDARLNSQQGVAYLRVTLNRAGEVLSANIERSSGFPSLDNETLALAQRASPLPAPPAEVTGNSVVLVIPVRFSLR